MNLFTVQLVNSIKFPDLIRVVAVVLYVEWIFNENNFSLFENNLVYQSNTLTLFTSSNFEIHFCKDMKPKELEFFAQNTSCVLLPLRFENWADQQRVKAKKPAKTMILYKSIVKWTSGSRLAHLLPASLCERCAIQSDYRSVIMYRWFLLHAIYGMQLSYSLKLDVAVRVSLV